MVERARELNEADGFVSVVANSGEYRFLQVR